MRFYCRHFILFYFILRLLLVLGYYFLSFKITLIKVMLKNHYVSYH